MYLRCFTETQHNSIFSFTLLHQLGYTHSVESWQDEKLVSDLYGISLGSAFFGESMFSKVSNASKFGFVKLVNYLIEKNFEIVDCQIFTEHLKSLGAEEIERKEFLNILEHTLEKESLIGKWVI